MSDLDERAAQTSAVIAFRATPDLVASIEAAASREGISKSDIARRAVLRDLKREDEFGRE